MQRQAQEDFDRDRQEGGLHLTANQARILTEIGLGKVTFSDEDSLDLATQKLERTMRSWSTVSTAAVDWINKDNPGVQRERILGKRARQIMRLLVRA